MDLDSFTNVVLELLDSDKKGYMELPVACLINGLLCTNELLETGEWNKETVEFFTNLLKNKKINDICWGYGEIHEFARSPYE